jgi:hypothetical protein
MVFTKYAALLAAVVLLAAVTFVFHLVLRAVGRKSGQKRGMLDLVMGVDLRTSTSKAQLALWTYAIALVLLAVLFLGRSWGCDVKCRTEHKSALTELKDSSTTFFNEAFQAEYLVLLGFPGLAAVIAKGITSSRVANNPFWKSSAATDRQSSAYLADIVSDDKGKGDLGDFQYFIFNAIALGYFFVGWLDAPTKGLPSLPDTLVALTGSSAAIYVAKKYVEKATARITLVDPPIARQGTTIHLAVTGLLPTGSADSAVVVTFTSRTAPPVATPVPGQYAAATSLLAVNLPNPILPAVGTFDVVVQSNAGLSTEPAPIVITA